MGPTPANGSHQNPLLYNLAQNWTDKTYGVKLDRTRYSFNDNIFANTEIPGGMLTLGGVDNSVLASNISFLPVVNISHSYQVWAVPLDGINIAGVPVRAVQTQPLVAFPDMVGQAIIGTHAVVGELYSHVPGALLLKSGWNSTVWSANAWVFPASSIGIDTKTNGTTPKASIGLEIILGGKTYPVADVDFAIKLITPSELISRWGATQTQAEAAPLWCIGGVQELEPWPRGLPIGFGLGLSFLRNVYTAYRFSPDSVGFGYLTPEAGAPVVSGPGTPRNLSDAQPSSPSTAQTSPKSTGKANAGVVKRANVIFGLIAAGAAVLVAI